MGGCGQRQGAWLVGSWRTKGVSCDASVCTNPYFPSPPPRSAIQQVSAGSSACSLVMCLTSTLEVMSSLDRVHSGIHTSYEDAITRRCIANDTHLLDTLAAVIEEERAAMNEAKAKIQVLQEELASREDVRDTWCTRQDLLRTFLRSLAVEAAPEPPCPFETLPSCLYPTATPINSDLISILHQHQGTLRQHVERSYQDAAPIVRTIESRVQFLRSELEVAQSAFIVAEDRLREHIADRRRKQASLAKSRARDAPIRRLPESTLMEIFRLVTLDAFETDLPVDRWYPFLVLSHVNTLWSKLVRSSPSLHCYKRIQVGYSPLACVTGLRAFLMIPHVHRGHLRLHLRVDVGQAAKHLSRHLSLAVQECAKYHGLLEEVQINIGTTDHDALSKTLRHIPLTKSLRITLSTVVFNTTYIHLHSTFATHLQRLDVKNMIPKLTRPFSALTSLSVTATGTGCPNYLDGLLGFAPNLADLTIQTPMETALSAELGTRHYTHNALIHIVTTSTSLIQVLPSLRSDFTLPNLKHLTLTSFECTQRHLAPWLEFIANGDHGANLRQLDILDMTLLSIDDPKSMQLIMGFIMPLARLETLKLAGRAVTLVMAALREDAKRMRDGPISGSPVLAALSRITLCDASAHSRFGQHLIATLQIRRHLLRKAPKSATDNCETIRLHTGITRVDVRDCGGISDAEVAQLQTAGSLASSAL